MCGIGGIIDISKASHKVSIPAMLESLKHRGPDGYGISEVDWGFLIHTRLSIIDTSEMGIQPFSRFDDSIVTLHNGEIYNYKKLLSSLVKLPTLISTSDSEIVPHYYNDFGIERLAKDLEGMFAIALLDKFQMKFYLIRDSYGIKPLYYYFNNGILIFGSEIKSILSALPKEERVISPQSAYDFMALGYIVEPSTFYKNIFAVPAGSILSFDLVSGDISIESFSDDLFSCKNETLRTDDVDKLLDSIVKEQCRADVPMASFLSGGIDSSLVSTYFSKQVRPAQTYTVAFQSKERNESSIALATAEYLNTEHTTIEPIHSLEMGLIDRLIKHFDQPFGDLSMLSTYLLCKEVGAHVKVALSGDGGDEFVAGYPKFKQLWLLGFMPSSMKKIFMNSVFGLFVGKSKHNRLAQIINKPLNEQIYETSSYLRGNDLELFFNDKFSNPSRHFLTNSRFSLIQNITISQVRTSLVSKMLPKVDRMSMLNSLEVRVPLLDRRLTQALFCLPDKKKLNIRESKVVYRELLKKHLPFYKNKAKIGFDYSKDELEKLGVIDYWCNHLSSIESSSSFWNLISRDKVNLWLEDFRENRSVTYSKQSQVQVIFHTYILSKWFEWNEV